ncbi:MAG: plasmid pRiA4b ORF-3 family protein [Acaryochloris sp. RU_4_1]|nr:plasmid pRiA4b ORF-3 family protein [Acaryochloris sp. RU_4_1]
MSNPSDPVIFQLKAVIAGISPMIWRRLQIHSDTTIADLHYILQICFSWSDDHLHRFTLQGKDYGVAKPGGEWFSDDANTITLAELGLRERERFLYHYDYFDNWQIQLRVEQITSPAAGKSYPRCIQGKRAGPPEDCGGPWAFQELRQEHSEFEVAYRVAQMVVHKNFEQLQAHRHQLYYWLTFEKLDLQKLNQQLQQSPLSEVTAFTEESIYFGS